MGIYERIFGSDDDLQYDDPYIVGDGEDYTPSYIKEQRPIRGTSTANIISEGIDQFGQAVVEDPVGVAKAVGTGIYESGKEFVQNPVETTTDFVTGVGESIYNVGTKSLTDYLPEGLDEGSASEEQMTQARQDRLNDFLNASIVVPAAGAGITGAKALANAMPDLDTTVEYFKSIPFPEYDPNTLGMNFGNIKFNSALAKGVGLRNYSLGDLARLDDEVGDYSKIKSGRGSSGDAKLGVRPETGTVVALRPNLNTSIPNNPLNIPDNPKTGKKGETN